MTFPSFLPVGAIIALVAVLAVSGCVPAAYDEQDSARLLEGINACLESQKTVESKLEAQSGKLDAMQSRLASSSKTADLKEPAQEREPCRAAAHDDKLLVGRLEQMWFPNFELMLTARVDTGAETSSIDARNIERFERNGKRWVRFEIVHPETGEGIALEREISRMVSIVQASQPEGERRPVILMEIAVGHIKQTAEFTLSDRSHLDYQALIGRNILQDVMVVDVSKKNVAPPSVGLKRTGKVQ